MKTVTVPVNAATDADAMTITQAQLKRSGVQGVVGIVATVSPNQRPNDQVAAYATGAGAMRTWDVAVQIDKGGPA